RLLGLFEHLHTSYQQYLQTAPRTSSSLPTCQFTFSRQWNYPVNSSNGKMHLLHNKVRYFFMQRTQ
ncbi:hypothetical protein V7149_05675, partial [Bacillus sp. JJ1503]|uniref:hypothetical protein n=1 Tax=Bacillus sp. JJ1503 TaxID=3122956 RepID=UPI002FFDE10B